VGLYLTIHRNIELSHPNILLGSTSFFNSSMPRPLGSLGSSSGVGLSRACDSITPLPG
jgi:hypothetical protein